MNSTHNCAGGTCDVTQLRHALVLHPVAPRHQQVRRVEPVYSVEVVVPVHEMTQMSIESDGISGV